MLHARPLLPLLIGALLAAGGCSVGKAQDGRKADPAATKPGPEGFRAWVTAFRAEALKEGITARTLRRAFRGVRYDPRVIRFDNYQPEFVKPVGAYVAARTAPDTIRRGQALMRKHGRLLRRMGRKYGVDPAYIVAIWRLESGYGANFGDMDVIRSLATLAYAGRRQGFWRGELIAALRILQRGDIPRRQLVGSWAGAMGHTQFIPSTFLKRGVDGDGDGKVDLWRSLPDVFASTANYLAEAKWKRGLPWGYEIILPRQFPYELADGRTRMSVGDWAKKHGIKAARGRLRHPAEEAAIVLPSGYRGPAFIVFRNYRSILAYNNALAYALTVGILAERLKGAPPVRQAWPVGDRLLNRDEKTELQNRLIKLGFDPGPVDGKVGPTTKKAIRAFQKSKGYPADGYANFTLLTRVRQASP